MTPQHYRQNQPPIRAFMPERLRGLYQQRLIKAAAARSAASGTAGRKGTMNMQDEKNVKAGQAGDPQQDGAHAENAGSAGKAVGNASESAGQSALGTVFVQVIERPARRLILKRGIQAEDYFAYCEEVGCDVWNVLTGIKDALYEPAGYWLPESFRKPGTSEYVQGVEVAADYSGPIPEGFEIIDLPAAQIMLFQGPPYDDADFENAIGSLWEIMDRYDPTLYGYRWAEEGGPRFQLERQGFVGDIEGRPVRKF